MGRCGKAEEVYEGRTYEENTWVEPSGWRYLILYACLIAGQALIAFSTMMRIRIVQGDHDCKILVSLQKMTSRKFRSEHVATLANLKDG